jgi:hypothetical protein
VTDVVEPLGRGLIVIGLIIVVIGVVFAFGSRIPVLGHLPGDIVIQRDGATIYLPIGTMVLISVVASVVLSLLGRR